MSNINIMDDNASINNENISLIVENLKITIKEQKKALTKMQYDLVKIEKVINKNNKLAEKILKKQKKNKHRCTGLTKPTKVSNELCEFLGINSNSLHPRTSITKGLTKYIKENNLQNPNNKKIILPNEELKSKMNIPDDFKGDITFFNLQRFIKHHYNC